jgi:hypothetical protein
MQKHLHLFVYMCRHYWLIFIQKVIQLYTFLLSFIDTFWFTQPLDKEIASRLHDILHKIIKTANSYYMYIYMRLTKVQIINGIPQAQIYYSY